MHIQDEGTRGTCRGGIRVSTIRTVQVDGCAHDVVPPSTCVPRVFFYSTFLVKCDFWRS